MPDPPLPPRDFLFVPVRGPRNRGGNPRGRREVRAYVAKEYFKKRRAQDIKNLQTVARAGWTVRQEEDDALAIRGHSSRLGERRYGEGSSTPSSEERSRDASPLPVVRIGVRKDPFDSYPVVMGKEDLELVDFWMTDLTLSRYTYHGEKYVPMRDLFAAQAVEHPASMHGLLFIAARLMSWSRAGIKGNQQVVALKHRATLLDLVNGAIRESNLKMPGLLQAIGFQVVHEAVLGNYESCRLHLIGLRSIVAALGGPIALNDQPRVQIIFMYLSLDTQPDYLPLPVPNPSPSSISSQQAGSRPPQTAPAYIYASKHDAAEVNQHITEFLTFLHRIESLSTTGWRFHRPSSTARNPSSSSTNPFAVSSTFHSLLSPKPNEFSAPGVLGVHRTTRLACLLLLNHALLALSAPSVQCDAYIFTQAAILLSEKVDRKPDLRTFLHLLLKHPEMIRLRDLECAHASARCAQVGKRLGPRSREKVGRLLLGCLSEERVGHDDRGPSLTEEDFERIRAEVYFYRPDGVIQKDEGRMSGTGGGQGQGHVHEPG